LLHSIEEKKSRKQYFIVAVVVGSLFFNSLDPYARYLIERYDQLRLQYVVVEPLRELVELDYLEVYFVGQLEK